MRWRTRTRADLKLGPYIVLFVVACAVFASFGSFAQSPRPFSVVEATIADMQKAMADGRATSRDIVQQSLTRIALYEDRLNAVIAVNPRALQEAEKARPLWSPKMRAT